MQELTQLLIEIAKKRVGELSIKELNEILAEEIAIKRESRLILSEIPELIKFVDWSIPNTFSEFEERFKRFTNG